MRQFSIPLCTGKGAHRPQHFPVLGTCTQVLGIPQVQGRGRQPGASSRACECEGAEHR